VDAIARHDDPGVRSPARVPAAQDRRPLTGLDQQPRQQGDRRCLAAAAETQIADADDRPGQPLLSAWSLVPTPPPDLRGSLQTSAESESQWVKARGNGTIDLSLTLTLD